jgi:uncharacterized protein (TIGR03435 family)
VGAAMPKFEVASIKPGCGRLDGGGTVSKDGRTRPNQSPGSLNECTTLIDFIRMAYLEFANGRQNPPEPVPISGGPAWIGSERYQINAKPEGAASPLAMRGPMLQALLEDRFKLKLHREVKHVAVYELTLSKGSPRLELAKKGSCFTLDPGSPLQPGQKPCGIPLTGTIGPNLRTEIIGSLDALSKVLGVTVGRPVINKTGIGGVFDVRLEFAIDESTPGVRPVSSTEDTPGPSIFTAVQQQLGLKLVSAKGPGESIFIDHVERPSEN